MLTYLDLCPSSYILVNDNDEDDDNDDDNEIINDNNDLPEDAGDFGDDFDDFEEGDNVTADQDFGDFDGFDDNDQPLPQQNIQDTQPLIAKFSLLDFDALSDLPDLLKSTKSHLDAMFPSTTSTHDSTFNSDSLPSDSPIFPSERSRSLWKQLITPPPLQPPNWTQSRIRRLFLISLGVPVDLDEVLPPSKQKKLILPDISLPYDL